MANHKSAEKRIRQNETRKTINRANRSKLRTQIKKLRTALGTQDKAASGETLAPTVSLIDKMSGKGIIHDNAAGRYKSRLARGVRAKTA